MNDTGIIWTEATWNPMSGCEKISAGCAFCYAHTLAENKRGTMAFPKGFDLTLRPHKLKEPFALKRPTLIFCNSMSDLFWREIPDEYRDKVVDVIEQTPQHQYQVLTKRADVLLQYSRRRRLPSNFWAGVSIENQDNAVRADLLREVRAEIRFISAEPLLGPLRIDWSGIQWVITGGESGNHLLNPKLREVRALVTYDGKTWSPRADRMDWVRWIRDDLKRSGGMFFHKQWGGRTPHSAGRELDGRTWDEFPLMHISKSNRGGYL
ncbi:MAG TPA: phage Gp37/Gp68 family protein [Planctomycetota bacterium]|nr:phage Gp37/Gp68 family protein [Planctomycetota bacterium]